MVTELPKSEHFWQIDRRLRLSRCAYHVIRHSLATFGAAHHSHFGIASYGAKVTLTPNVITVHKAQLGNIGWVIKGGWFRNIKAKSGRASSLNKKSLFYLFFNKKVACVNQYESKFLAKNSFMYRDSWIIFMFKWIRLFVCLSVRASVHSFIWLSVILFVYSSIVSFVRSSELFSVRPSVRLSV